MAKKSKKSQIVTTRFKKPKKRLFLAQWRKHRTLTQTQLGDRCDVSQGMISQLETGESDYTGELLEKLAYGLRCEPADLIMRNPLDPDAPWSIWDKLKPEQRRTALRMLRALADESEEAA